MSALAFRVAAQGLAARGGDALDVLRSWTVQDSPPGAAATAVAARARDADLAARLEDRGAVALYNARTATAVLPAGEAAAFASGLLPEGDEELRAVLGRAVPGRDEGLAEPAALAADAIADALDGRTLGRDDLHEELRRRLPAALLPWCEGCGSHHARRGLLVLAGLRGRLCIAGRAGRQPLFARTDQWIGWSPPPRDEAGAELLRRYLHAYAPSTPAAFASWAGIAAARARELWAALGDEVRDGALAADARALARPRKAEGVRLLGPGDPLLLARDREVLVPDEALRRAVFRATGGPGVVLVDGALAGLWRARRKGRRLEVEVEEHGPVDLAAVRAEAERLAPLRGASEVAVGSSRS